MDKVHALLPIIKQSSPIRLIVPMGHSLLFDGFEVIEVEDTRQAYLNDCECFYESLFSSFTLLGVTGTKGKTTIAWWFTHALRYLGVKTAYIGTLGIFDTELHPGVNTSVGLQTLIAELKKFKNLGISTVVCEVSSQGLDQFRVPVRYFSLRIFTDLSEEHLDHHGNMQNYLNSKLQFFIGGRFDGLILDRTQYFSQIQEVANQKLHRYGLLGQGHLPELALQDSLNGIKLISHSLKLEVPFTGFFNAENILAVMEGLLLLGYSLDQIKNVVHHLPQVPGRMERISHPGGAQIFVDYAHSAQSLEFVLKSVSDLRLGRLILVFGCGGDRDPAKRPRMGRAAARFCDVIFLTSDNPRTEDPEKIMDAIQEGIGDHPGLQRMSDRRMAIQAAVELLGPEDVLLVCGKGHEDYQIVGNQRLHFSDREEIEAVCRTLV
ncbi:MAG: UDP-N-acetylmuramoyl-L-alanyl-D-glutamate--2,6-diaminopimelate ligase [Candidatus Cloacimonetes bacterium]|nr:UDP-N-acetylmuramoyl-L-alanyl-D-glutamate--2,6-diaminopimelate ligase [Candidatus Cloacimonadota bacterium]